MVHGAEALLLMAERTGLLRFSLPFLRLSPVLFTLELAYGVMARNRRFFGRFLFTTDHDPP